MSLVGCAESFTADLDSACAGDARARAAMVREFPQTFDSYGRTGHEAIGWNFLVRDVQWDYHVGWPGHWRVFEGLEEDAAAWRDGPVRELESRVVETHEIALREGGLPPETRDATLEVRSCGAAISIRSPGRTETLLGFRDPATGFLMVSTPLDGPHVWRMGPGYAGYLFDDGWGYLAGLAFGPDGPYPTVMIPPVSGCSGLREGAFVKVNRPPPCEQDVDWGGGALRVEGTVATFERADGSALHGTADDRCAVTLSNADATDQLELHCDGDLRCIGTRVVRDPSGCEVRWTVSGPL